MHERVRISADSRGYRVDLTDTERAALLRAVEAGRALLLRDPNLRVLARETRVSPDLLDELADQLFLTSGSDPPESSPSTLARADVPVASRERTTRPASIRRDI